jgi:hypothetical protein
MKYIKISNGLLKMALFAAFVAAFIYPTLTTVFAIFAGLVFFSFLLKPQSNVMYGVVLETWANYIIERFFKDNQFLKFAYDDSSYVVAGRIVHIPQPGSKPAVVKNRSSWPATAVRRTDTDVTYTLDEYSTDPTHIPNIDAIHLSYDKQDSVLGDHMSVLDETVADDMLIKWGGNGTFVSTTGVTINADGTQTVKSVAPVPGQVGNRFAFTEQDLVGLMIKMNQDNVAKQDRYLLIDDYMYAGFYASLSGTNAKDFSRYSDAANGVIGKLHGFNIMTRSSVLAATSANAVKALGAALGATDNLCSLAWQKNSVAFAIGDKKLFQNTNDALYQGDVHSALLMAGGRVRRGDGKGIYIIAQGS